MNKFTLIIIFLMIACAIPTFAADQTVSNDPEAFSSLSGEEAHLYLGAYFTGHYWTAVAADLIVEDFDDLKKLEHSAKVIGVDLAPPIKSIKKNATLRVVTNTWREQIFKTMKASPCGDSLESYFYLGSIMLSVSSYSEVYSVISPVKPIAPDIKKNTISVLNNAVEAVKSEEFPKDLQDTMIMVYENYKNAKTNKEAFEAVKPCDLWSAKLINTLLKRAEK